VDLADVRPEGVVRGTMRPSGASVKIPFLDRLPLPPIVGGWR